MAAEVPLAAPAAAAPADARREAVTHVSGDYVAGLWYGEAPAPLLPSTSYVMPFERKASAQQRKAELDRIKHDRTEADIAEAKRKGGVLGSIKATTMSVFAKARGTATAPASRKLARKEKKFNNDFKFAQPETLLYQSKKLRIVNRHNNSTMLGKLWISSNFVCFRESLRGTKSRTMLTIPVREIVCIQRARALKVTEANAVPEFQPYSDMDSSADSLLIYMRDRELHQLTGFWDHKSLEDTYHTLDYVWRPQAYAAEIPPAAAVAHDVPPAEASGSSSPSSSEGERDSKEASRTIPAAAVAAVPAAVVLPAAAGYALKESADRQEVLRTMPPYASLAAPVVVAPPVAVAPPVVAAPPVVMAPPVPESARRVSVPTHSTVIYSEPFVVRPFGETAIVGPATRTQLPVVMQMSQRRALPPGLKSEIEAFPAWFPRRHVALPARPPLSSLFAPGERLLQGGFSVSRARLPQYAAQTARFEPATFMPTADEMSSRRTFASTSSRTLTGGMRASYPRQPEVLLRDIRSFRRSRLLRPRVRRGWRPVRFANVLRAVRTFNLRTLRHVPAPVIRSQLPRVRGRGRTQSLSRTGPTLMSEELKERITAFSSLHLLTNFRHVVPTENRFLNELRVARLPLPNVHRALRRELLSEIVRFNHSWLRPSRTIRRRYAQYLSLEEIRKCNRNPTRLMREIRAFDRSRLRNSRGFIRQGQATTQKQSRQVPEWSPVAHMPWWPALSTSLRQQPQRRLRHVPAPSVPVFRAPAELTTGAKPSPARDTAGVPSTKIEVMEMKRVVVMEPLQQRQQGSTSSTGFGPAGLSV